MPSISHYRQEYHKTYVTDERGKNDKETIEIGV